MSDENIKEIALEKYGRWKAEHQRYLAENEKFEEYQNEYRGLLRRRNVNADRMALEKVLSDYAVHKNLAFTKKRKPWLRLTTELIILTAGLLTIWQLTVNADFRQWLSDNSILLVILIIASIVTYVVVKKNRES